MKKKWYEILDSTRFAITILLIGYLFIGIGNIQAENEVIKKILLIFSSTGSLIKDLFPLGLTLNYIGKNKKDVIPFMGALLCYFLMNVITMVIGNSNYASEFYCSILGITTSTGLKPLNLGVFGSVIIILLVNAAYDLSRKRYNYGFLTFIDNDAWFLITAFLFTTIASIAVSFGYVYLVSITSRLMDFISANSTNPTVLFIYGTCEKLGEMFQLENIFKNNFLFGALGGNWIDNAQTVYNGDINIWTAQLTADSLSVGTGKYTSASYIINLFAAPSLIIGYYLNITDKIDKSRMLGMLLMGIACSVLTASPLPIEIVIFLTSPMLYFLHILLSGFIYMSCGILGIYIGVMSNVANQSTLCIGTIFEFIHYYSVVNLHQTMLKALIMGIIVFILYQLLVFVYYHILAQDFLDSETGKIEVSRFIELLGGINNIKKITSSSVAITVVLNDRDKLDVNGLLADRAYKVTERYYGFIIEYGAGSSSICRKVRKAMQDYQTCLQYSKK